MTKTFTLVRTAALALIATGFITLAPAAHAADDDGAPQAEINVAGTDFTSVKAVDHLITRLHRVALDICVRGDQRGMMSDDERTCVDTAIKGGLAQIDSRREQAMRETGVHVATAQPAGSPAH